MKNYFFTIVLLILYTAHSFSMMFEPFVFDKVKKEGTGPRNLMYCLINNKNSVFEGHISNKNFHYYKDIVEKHLEHVKTKKEQAPVLKKNILKKAAYYAIASISLFAVGTAVLYTMASKLNHFAVTISLTDALTTTFKIDVSDLTPILLCSYPLAAIYAVRGTGKQLIKYAKFNKHVDNRIKDDEQALDLLKQYEQKKLIVPTPIKY